uniref:EF-hand domain-containing protein n=2 Tax=Arion vulgaris TaxID=1028688 RepID=A0A0B6ZGM7_9EUPU
MASVKVIILLLIFAVYHASAQVSVRYPVILIPGDGGSQLVAKLNKTTSPHYICRKYTSDYESIWLNLEELLPEVLDCFVDNMRLLYDPQTRTTFNTPGVDIQANGFGETDSVEFLDPNPVTHFSSSLSYFYFIVNDLVTMGYARGLSVRGAPFDFRKAPNELGDYFIALKKLVEETYEKNNNTKVVVIAHSMGSPVFLYFLNRQPQEWKDKFIQSFVTLAGVWGGAVKPLRLMASGDNLGVIIVNTNKIRPQQRSMPSTAFLMPDSQFWSASEVLVSTPDKNYTVANYKEFFADMNFTDGYNMRMDTENLVRDLTPPQVPVHCIHGSGVPTPAAFIFGKDQFPDTYPKEVDEDGDGTVNIRSLFGCLKWVGKQKYPVMHVHLNGSTSDHMAILSNSDARQYIKDVVTGKR